MSQSSPTFRRLALLLLLAASCYACSVSDNLLPAPPAPAPSPEPAPQKKPPPEAPPDEGKTATLATPQLARRLALDLTMRLPNAADATLMTADATKSLAVINSYLSDRASAAALASLHPRMWHLSSHALADLDAYVDAGDSALSSALTTPARQAIVQEPSLAVRYILENHLPWRKLFDAASIIAPTSLLPLWQASDLGPAFANEPYRLATAFSTAAPAGLLVDPAFLASIGGRGDSGSYQRTGRLFKELLCIANAAPAVHDLRGLSGAELTTDLVPLALTKTECRGCHATLEGARQAYDGFASGSTFSAWLQAPAATSTPYGSFGGTNFQGLAGLGKLVGGDGRMQRCEVLRLFEELYQRSYNDGDQATLALAQDAFLREGESLAAAARVLTAGADYATSPVGPSVKGGGKRTHSGVKLLGRAQWEALFTTLLPKNNLLFTDDLDPGHAEAFTSADHVPSGNYWHAVDLLARQAASALVAEELGDQVLAVNRHLLTTLPDGAAAAAGAGVVSQQIQDLWLTLTGVQLTTKDPVFTDLQALWAKLNPDGTAQASRLAWRALLTAVFSHPALVTY